jgi:hypothetical protein
MSDQPNDVLVDSVSYFRLAYCIRPLLRGSFGSAPPYTLHVLSVLDDEFNKSDRLQHKFGWVGDPAFKNDRAAKRYKIGKKKVEEEVHRTVKYLARYADEKALNVSLEDIKALAVGFVKSVPVVTDDMNMTEIAKAHNIDCWSTIKLLKLMHSSGKINDAKVEKIVKHWHQQKDLPMSLERVREVFKEYFGKDCPI